MLYISFLYYVKGDGNKFCCCITVNTHTTVLVSRSIVCPHSVSSLADLKTVIASCAAWLISPFFRNSSKLLSSPMTKFFNVLATCSTGERQGSSSDDGTT